MVRTARVSSRRTKGYLDRPLFLLAGQLPQSVGSATDAASLISIVPNIEILRRSWVAAIANQGIGPNAFLRNRRRAIPPLHHAIANIVERSADKEVVRIDACRNIAVMAGVHPFGDEAAYRFKGNVSRHTETTTDLELPIALATE
jgi:hypothetical protein